MPHAQHTWQPLSRKDGRQVQHTSHSLPCSLIGRIIVTLMLCNSSAQGLNFRPSKIKITSLISHSLASHTYSHYTLTHITHSFTSQAHSQIACSLIHILTHITYSLTSHTHSHHMLVHRLHAQSQIERHTGAASYTQWLINTHKSKHVHPNTSWRKAPYLKRMQFGVTWRSTHSMFRLEVVNIGFSAHWRMHSLLWPGKESTVSFLSWNQGGCQSLHMHRWKITADK